LSISSTTKSSQAFRTIAEAAEELDVAAHVLRFWEGKFTQLRPLKRAGGRRHYRPDDMALLRGIRALLNEDGYQLKGVQKLLRDQGVGWVRDRGLSGSALELDSSDEAPALDLPPKMPLHLRQDPVESAASGPLFQDVGSHGDLDALSPAAGIRLRQAMVKLERARQLLDNVLISAA
jgi:DNA-binding transcriptional MerR regulator